jgi:hypothetical protein
MYDDGEWPSGKALGSGPRIGGSNPSSPASTFVSVRVQRLSGKCDRVGYNYKYALLSYPADNSCSFYSAQKSFKMAFAKNSRRHTYSGNLRLCPPPIFLAENKLRRSIQF